jgi:hypothetical protein
MDRGHLTWGILNATCSQGTYRLKAAVCTEKKKKGKGKSSKLFEHLQHDSLLILLHILLLFLLLIRLADGH